MSDDLEERLAAASQAMRERELVAKQRTDLLARQDELSAEVSTLEDQYAKEAADVARLEGMSLGRVLAAMSGSREERLARERAEADAAKYKAAQAHDRLDAIERQLTTVQRRLDQLAAAPAAYAAALDEKERQLTASPDPRGASLLHLAEERGRLTGELKEIGEAQAAAGAALDALSQVQQSLSSAAGWSTYDTWFGGGVIASSVKHDRMDSAAQEAAEADRRLAVLRTELADVGDPGLTAPQLAVGGGTKFADVWFDNFFTDISVDGRIKQAQQNVESSIQTVRRLQAKLTSTTEQVQARLAGNERARQDLLSQ